ncbi:hypothetical protein N9Y17_02360 [Gammaproteobacteria bacterium]|nr:hypothetical protein [Gammaproteobacteria bacterium]
MNSSRMISYVLLVLASVSWLVQSSFLVPLCDILFIYASWLFWRRSPSSPYQMGALGIWMDVIMGTPLGSQGLIMTLLDWVIAKHRSEQVFVGITGLALIALLVIRVWLLTQVTLGHTWVWILMIFLQDLAAMIWCWCRVKR